MTTPLSQVLGNDAVLVDRISKTIYVPHELVPAFREAFPAPTHPWAGQDIISSGLLVGYRVIFMPPPPVVRPRWRRRIALAAGVLVAVGSAVYLALKYLT